MIVVSCIGNIGDRSGINPARRCIMDCLGRHLGDSDNFDFAGIKGSGNGSIESKQEAQGSVARNLHNGRCYCCICKSVVSMAIVGSKVNLIRERVGKMVLLVRID